MEVENPATIEHIEARIYRGPRHDLRIKPFIITDGNRYPIPSYEGKQYLDGEDDTRPLDVSESVEKGDEIGVEVINKEPDHPYNFYVDMSLDYENGAARPLRSLLGRVL